MLETVEQEERVEAERSGPDPRQAPRLQELDRLERVRVPAQEIEPEVGEPCLDQAHHPERLAAPAALDRALHVPLGRVEVEARERLLAGRDVEPPRQLERLALVGVLRQ